MEFKEFKNPESADFDIDNNNPESADYDLREESDYDLRNELVSNINEHGANIYSEKLLDLIGFLEDIDEEQIKEEYGISYYEYLNPNAKTIAKVVEKLNKDKKRRHM